MRRPAPEEAPLQARSRTVDPAATPAASARPNVDPLVDPRAEAPLRSEPAQPRAAWPARLAQRLRRAWQGLGDVLRPSQTRALRELTEASRQRQAARRTEARQPDEPLPHAGRGDALGELARELNAALARISAQRAEITRLAGTDATTGLPQRRLFVQQVDAALAAASGTGRPVAVLLLQLQGLPALADGLGPGTVGLALQAAARRLQAQPLPRAALLGCLAGEGVFPLLLPGLDAAGALNTGAPLADLLALPLTLGDHEVTLTAVCGAACWPLHAADGEALLQAAETALWIAHGRHESAAAYDGTLAAQRAASLSALAALPAALGAGQLRLLLQPRLVIGGTSASRPAGVQAHLYWQHPRRGLLPPSAFMPLAGLTGQSRPLLLWLVQAAAQQWPTLRALGMARLSVRLAPRDLEDPALSARLLHVLQQHGVPSTALCLQIPESALAGQAPRALAATEALGDAGFRLAVCHFGSGGVGLVGLKQLPVDELVLDRTLVAGMARDAADARSVAALVELAQGLCLSVVAEGVDSAAALEQLSALHCDEGLGLHLGRPVPSAELAAELAAVQIRWQVPQHGGPGLVLH